MLKVSDTTRQEERRAVSRSALGAHAVTCANHMTPLRHAHSTCGAIEVVVLLLLCVCVVGVGVLVVGIGVLVVGGHKEGPP